MSSRSIQEKEKKPPARSHPDRRRCAESAGRRRASLLKSEGNFFRPRRLGCFDKTFARRCKTRN